MLPAAVQAPEFGDLPLRLTRLLGRVENPADLPFETLPEGRDPQRCVAVDGSSVQLLDGQAFSVYAYRAGSILLAGGRVEHRVPSPRAVLLERAGCREALAEALAGAGCESARLPERLSPSACLDHLRTLAEIRAAREALEHLGEGDLLLVDGALQVRDPVPPRSLMEELLGEAAARGVAVVGVCKGTSLTVGNAPALPFCAREARLRGLDTWFVPLPRPTRGTVARVFAAKLSAAEPRAFRFDVAPGVEPGDALALAASLCGHPAYPGYPSPLAMVHQAVLLDEATAADIARQLRAAAEDCGANGETWELAFDDYHDVLNLGA